MEPIGNEEIARGIHRDSSRPAQRRAGGRDRRWVVVVGSAARNRGDGARPEGQLRPASNAINGHAGQHIARTIAEHHRAHARAGGTGREIHVDHAVCRRGITHCRAGGPGGVGKVQAGDPRGENGNAAYCCARSDGEGKLDGRGGRSNGLGAKIHAPGGPPQLEDSAAVGNEDVSVRIHRHARGRREAAREGADRG